jgi:large subunit ribosomal protein L23
MGIFDFLKKKEQKEVPEAAPASDGDKTPPPSSPSVPPAEVAPEQKKEPAKESKEAKLAAEAAPLKISPEEKVRATYILRRPITSEKTTLLNEQRQYTFEVSYDATKIDIIRAVKAVYGVVPVRVNVIRGKGKPVRFGRFQGNRKRWKKAIVTLRAGQSIQIYDHV